MFRHFRECVETPYFTVFMKACFCRGGPGFSSKHSLQMVVRGWSGVVVRGFFSIHSLGPGWSGVFGGNPTPHKCMWSGGPDGPGYKKSFRVPFEVIVLTLFYTIVRRTVSRKNPGPPRTSECIEKNPGPQPRTTPGPPSEPRTTPGPPAWASWNLAPRSLPEKPRTTPDQRMYREKPRTAAPDHPRTTF
jgi:hypothetical protein